MLEDILGDETMSNLTSAISNEAHSICISSTNNKRSQEDICNNNNTMYSNTTQQPPAKKKRNLPGNPDPESEVVALSPRTLMATNRFVCEMCNKGFQRDQNLQLHRRGHNLPWKLKTRSKLEVIKKKVYVCPESSCAHHDPSRALGDLTGIKKHFSRKHGEKKWKCEKCSKRYAVQSDWKAHSKICGTREYRCDCGTLFSRRDSFITHRAFCDALAEESNSRISHVQNPLLFSSQTAPDQNFNLLPSWLSSSESGAPGPIGPHLILDKNPNPNYISSATALLQKATLMGVTMSTKNHHMGVQGFCAATSSSEFVDHMTCNGIMLNPKMNMTRDFLGLQRALIIPQRQRSDHSFVDIDHQMAGSSSSSFDQRPQINQPHYWHT